LNQAAEEEYRLTVAAADSWPFLSKKKYVCEECARAASGTHCNFSSMNLRRNAFTAQLLDAPDHSLEQLH
jgi:hypothetical protein